MIILPLREGPQHSHCRTAVLEQVPREPFLLITQYLSLLVEKQEKSRKVGRANITKAFQPTVREYWLCTSVYDAFTNYYIFLYTEVNFRSQEQKKLLKVVLFTRENK